MDIIGAPPPAVWEITFGAGPVGAGVGVNIEGAGIGFGVGPMSWMILGPACNLLSGEYALSISDLSGAKIL